jgi:hypothetical protein
MGKLRAYISHMTQELIEHNLDEATAKERPELSLKNAFERNFSMSVKMNFSSWK